MEFSKTEKGKPVLLYQGFEYIHHRMINDSVHWRCRQNKSLRCHSKISTKTGNIMYPPTNHSHESCPQKALGNIAITKMKKAMNGIGARPRDVIGAVLKDMN
jgi:FLYWCH zinc finger domain